MTEIKGEDYIVNYDPETVSVVFQGELALGGPLEYKPIKDLLSDIADSDPANITLNLRELKFFNSSGINMLSKFVLTLKKKEGTKLVILGCHDIAWQSKSLKNFQKLLPSVELNIE